MNPPNWYPNHTKSCVKAIELLEEIPGEGIFFIEYPDLWAEEITNLLKGFFSQQNNKFIKFDEKDFNLDGNLDSEFSKFIEGIHFETGPKKYSLKIITDDNQNSKINLFLDGSQHDIENPSHLTLLQSIRTAHFILQNNINCVCFQIRTGILGIETSDIINQIFMNISEKIKNLKKNIIIFYSDDDYQFTKRYIWKPNCFYKSFAILDSHDSYRIQDYDISVAQIEKALAIDKYKRLELFLGAGVGIQSGLPSGRMMLLKALQEITNNKKIDNFEELFKSVRKIDVHSTLPHSNKNVSLEHIMTLMKICRQYDDLTQSEVIKDFEEKHAKVLKTLSSGYKILKEFSEQNILILAVTTNFDQLLESSMNNPNIIVDDLTFGNTDFRALIHQVNGNSIIKLHGCRKYPNTLGITSENIQELSSNKKVFFKEYLCNARMEGRLAPVFFIGYNFADPDIIKELTRDIEMIRIHPIIINPKVTETVKYFMEKFEKQTNRTTHIPFTFDFFMETVKLIIQKNEKQLC